MRPDCALTAKPPLPRSRSFLCGLLGDLGSGDSAVPWLVVLAETLKVGKADVCLEEQMFAPSRSGAVLCDQLGPGCGWLVPWRNSITPEV